MRHALLAAASIAALMSLPSGAIFADAGPAEARLAELETELGDIQTANEAILAKADEENRDLTDDEVNTIQASTAKMETITKQINARKAALKASGQGRRTEPGGGQPAAGSAARVLNHRIDPRHGFDNMGQFALAARAHAKGANESEPVKKLLAAATTYGNENTGADGGFLVPPEFAAEIWKKVEAEENLMDRCVPLTPEGNSMNIPKDEATPWGSSGLQANWDGEAATIAPSKAVFENSNLRLNKLTCLAPVTDEMLEDARGFTSWIQAKVPGIFSHKINTAIVAGSGVGMPLGILKSASLVSVAKATSQPADTIWFTNIQDMWARMYAPWRRNAVWLINQDLEAQLDAMAFQPAGAASQVPTSASTPVYLPPGGLSDTPYGRLKGRPVIPLQACSGIGDQGDIILVDFNQYWVLKKLAGMRTDTSIHLYFDQSITAFRFIFRIGGQPAWSGVITPQNSAKTLSWAVTLDAR